MLQSEPQSQSISSPPSSLDEVVRSQRLPVYRFLLLILALVYMAWWFIVEIVFPSSYNPFWTRFAVTIIPFVFYVLSFRSEWVRRRIEAIFYVTTWLVTLQNFHLKYVNYDDIRWWVGSYITVIGIGCTYSSQRGLIAYSIFTVILGGLSSYFHGFNYVFFVPGLATILFIMNLGLLYRMRVLKKLAEATLAADAERRKHAKAQAAVRLRDDFISIASHELKTPLTPMKLHNDMLRKSLLEEKLQELSKAKLERILESNNVQIRRLTRLIDEMLDVSRIHSGHLPLNMECFDLKELLEQIAATFGGDISDMTSKLVVRCDGPLHVEWDKGRTEQVITNLLKNAVLYGQGKPVELSAYQEGEIVTVSVKDHGIGIALSDQKRIFDRFERAVSARQFGGLGVGLYIVSRIVQAHRGTIEVRSEPGEGSEFLVRIPAITSSGTVSFMATGTNL